MKTFETAQDVLDNAKELHHLAGRLYQQLHDNIGNDRAKMLLSYMIDHEEKMEQNITRYEDHAPQSILGTWMQYTLEESPQRFIEALETSANMTIGEITLMGQQVDTYLVNLFEEVTHTAATNNISDVFKSLMVMQEEEKHTLTRAANSLWEL
jgi:hypothetical protein